MYRIQVRIRCTIRARNELTVLYLDTDKKSGHLSCTSSIRYLTAMYGTYMYVGICNDNVEQPHLTEKPTIFHHQFVLVRYPYVLTNATLRRNGRSKHSDFELTFPKINSRCVASYGTRV